MKNAIKVLVFTVAFIAIAAGALFGVVKYNQSDFTYVDGDEKGTIAITSYNGKSVNIKIPEKIKGKTIVSIDRNAFADLGIKSVVVPEAVTGIESSAFAGCAKLEKVTLGNSVKYLGDKAFEGCAKLSEINFPEKLKSIGSLAFNGCESLKDVKIADGADFAIENGVVYNKDKTQAFFALNGVDYSNFAFSENLKELPDSFFFGNEEIKSFTIPDGIRIIPDSFFAMCTNLKDVKIPDSVVTIGNSAFLGCSSLDKLNVPKSVRNFDSYCFPVAVKKNSASADSKMFNKNFTLVVEKDSAAYNYAVNNEIKYELAK
ncbi:MAG: leucine-rich repeat domain-containing protein [Clostridia bacterium]|nr:leucine-rich repeat domain-containing protein [Clostridia bacterium]